MNLLTSSHSLQKSHRQLIRDIISGRVRKKLTPVNKVIHVEPVLAIAYLHEVIRLCVLGQKVSRKSEWNWPHTCDMAINFFHTSFTIALFLWPLLGQRRFFELTLSLLDFSMGFSYQMRLRIIQQKRFSILFAIWSGGKSGAKFSSGYKELKCVVTQIVRRHWWRVFAPNLFVPLGMKVCLPVKVTCVGWCECSLPDYEIHLRW